MADLKSRFSVYNKKVFAVAFLVALLTLLVYLPALKNDFVNWDDQIYVYENPYIQSIDFKFLKWILTTFHASHWHPLTWLSHAIDYAIWGLNPMGHHLTNIILHALNTFLVVLIIIRLVNYAKYKSTSQTPPRYGSIPTIEGWESQGGSVEGEEHTPLIAGAITGLLFGIHPLHVESVAWISERKDVLCAFFFLLSILSYLKYTSSQRQKFSRHPSVVARHWWYSLCLIFFVLSLMSKPMAVTLPVVLILLDIYPLERLHLKSAFTSQRKVLIEKIPFIVLSLVSSVITVMAALQKAIEPLKVHPLGERLLIAVRTPIFYLFKMFFPINLAPLYPYPSKISFLTLGYTGAFLLLICITAFCIWSWKGHQIFLTTWAYYIVTLLPVSGIIQVGAQTAADRFTYLPSLGPFLLAGIGFSLLCYRFKTKFIYAIVLSLLILVPLSAITIKQIKIWKDSLTLWNSELKMFSTVKAYNNRGKAFSDLGAYYRAISDYDKALELNPFLPEPYFNRGFAYAGLGNYQQAIIDCTFAIELNPQYAKAYNNRGIFYSSLGNYQKSIEDFNTAIKLRPQYIGAYYNRGITYRNLGNYQQAIQDLTVAIQLDSQYIKAYYNRASIYLKLNNYQNAINDLQTAARLGDKQAQDYLKSKGIGW
jgi:lipoprotein NlpI